MTNLLWAAVVLCVVISVDGFEYFQPPDPSFYEFARINHYPDDACHTTADGTQIYCYIQNAKDIHTCIRMCVEDASRCKRVKFTKLNECVFFIDNSTRTCEDHGVANIKEWTFNNWKKDQDGTYELITVTYAKKYEFTGLRVRWMGNMRSGRTCNGCGIAYWFKFNGANCHNPEKIDHIWYNGNQQRSERRHGEFEGICYGLPSGDVTISFYIGKMPSNHAKGNALTGWGTSNRIIAEEVDMRENIKPCVTQSVFNVKQKAKNNAHTETDTGEISQLTFVYKKLASDTGLRLKAYTNMRGLGSSHCIRYYFTMNDQECSDPYPVDTSISWLEAADSSQQLGTRSFEGICDGLPAGDYTIKLMVDACPWGNTRMNAYTGWHSTSRIIAEEVRYNRPALPVYFTDGTSQESSVFNAQHWNWYNIFDRNNNASIVTVRYRKLSDTSGIRLLFNAVTRVTKNLNECARWFFTFNGHECSNPGQLEGLHKENSGSISKFNKIRPKTVSGICRGTAEGDLKAGEYYIALHVGECQTGNVLSNTVITGYQTRMTIMAEEVMYSEGPGHN